MMSKDNCLVILENKLIQEKRYYLCCWNYDDAYDVCVCDEFVVQLHLNSHHFELD